MDSGLSESLLGIFAKSARKSSSEFFSSELEYGSGLDGRLPSGDAEDEQASFRFFIPIVLEQISPSSKSSQDRFQISGVSPSFSRCLQ